MSEPAARNSFDVCIVGTGAAGGVLAEALTELGLRVVALQRGPLLNSRDFDGDELETVVRDDLFSTGHLETVRSSAETPAEAGRFGRVGHCVGGAMTRWGGRSWRLRPEEFRRLAKVGDVPGATLADWPIDYAELEPHYAWAERAFGVAGNASANPFAPPRLGPYPNPPHPERSASEIVGAGARALGWHPYPTPVAINSRAYGGRARCTYRGACQGYGCPEGAKATTLSVSLPRALATGRLDLRPNARAFEIRLDESGRARRVAYLDWKRREREVSARAIVLAAGGVGTPQILLASRSGSFPDGLANASGLVGRNLMLHLASTVFFTTDRPSMGMTGLSSHVAVDDLRVEDPKRGFVGGGVVFESNEHTGQPLAWSEEAVYGNPLVEQEWGAPLMTHMRARPRAVEVTAVIEDLPMASNRVDLDPEVRDDAGLPVARLTHAQHSNDLEAHAWFGSRLTELAEACGGRDRWLSRIPGRTWIDEEHSIASTHLGHALGTCRMGRDPSRSVVDRWGRAHDVPGLWVADGSVFPTAGAAEPTLTIIANARRIARQVALGLARREA